MSGWKAKRFWTGVSVEAAEGGFAVHLDGRPVRTPAKAQLTLPTRPLAEAVAAEWAAVDGAVVPDRMPVTRAANSAIDKVTPQFGEVAAMLLSYGSTDLLCYRAQSPEELTAGQASAWDPLLDWSARVLGAPLRVTQGIVAVDQPESSLRALGAVLNRSSAFQLTGLHDLVSLTGSLVLGIAATSGDHDPETIWRLSRFDEDWQERLWGTDEEAAANTALKRKDFLQAQHFWKLSTSGEE